MGYKSISSQKDAVPDQIQEIVNNSLTELNNFYQKQIAELKAQADNNIPKISNSIINCDQYGKVGFPANFEKRWNWPYGTRSIEEIEKDYLAKVAEIHDKNEEVHKNNVPHIENNKIVIARLTAFLSSIGMPENYSDYTWVRNKRKTITTTSGWKNDLNHIVVRDGYESSLVAEKDCKDRLVEYINNRKKKEKEEQDKIEQEKKDAKVKETLIKVGLKYGLAEGFDKDSVLDAILSKSKYLRLAYSFEQNRNDWNDGYSYAEYGLSNFNVETDEDKLIVAAAIGIINSEDVDGRYFRDDPICNYSKLYSMVDEEVHKDFVKICEINN